MLVAGVIALIGGFVLLPLSWTLAPLLLATALLAAGFGLASPTLHALISRRADDHAQGAALGVAQSASSLARILAPALAGVVFAAWGREWPYFISAMVLAVAGIGALRLARARAADPG